MRDLRVELLTDLSALQLLAGSPEAPWPALRQRSPWATPFDDPAWLLPWAEAFGHPETLALAFWDGAELAGLLPMSIYPDPRTGQRQLLLLGAGTSDYLGGLFLSGVGREAIADGLRLLQSRVRWDTGHFAQLRPYSPLALAFAGLGATVSAGEPCSRCPALPVASLPRKVRADVLFFRNAATAHGRLSLRLADERTALADFETLVAFHTAGWQQRGEPGVLSDPQVLRHHRCAIPQLLRGGLLRLYTLELDGQPVAVLYALADPPGGARPERTLYTYLIGHAPEYSGVHPGTLLTALAAEAAAAEGLATVDMLRGNESYKRFWRVTPVETLHFTLPRTDPAAAKAGAGSGPAPG